MAVSINGNGTVTGLSALPDSAMASGSVIQVVTAHTSSKTTTKLTTYQDISGLSLLITPVSTSSKILVHVNLTLSHTSTADGALFSLARIVGGTTFRPADHPSVDMTNQLHNGAELSGLFTHSAHFLDNPSTTSEINYKYQVRHYSSSFGNLIVGGRTSDMPQTMNLTAMEVSA